MPFWGWRAGGQTKISRQKFYGHRGLGSRLHFLLQNPWIPEGFLKALWRALRRALRRDLRRGLWRVLEGFGRVLIPVSPRTLQNPFKTPSRTLQKPVIPGVEIDDALGFPGAQKSVPGCGGPVAGNDSLERSVFCIFRVLLKSGPTAVSPEMGDWYLRDSETPMKWNMHFWGGGWGQRRKSSTKTLCVRLPRALQSVPGSGGPVAGNERHRGLGVVTWTGNRLEDGECVQCGEGLICKGMRETRTAWQPCRSWLDPPSEKKKKTLQKSLWHKIITYEKLFWNNHFRKITNLTRNSLKMSFFPGLFERTKCLKNSDK